MTGIFDSIGYGFWVAASPGNLLFCFVGALLGTLVGVLPGIGPLATVAMLLPITFYLDPVTALVMLAGIYYGAQYGSSTSAILVNLPGETSSIVTCLDGHQMARQGRAGSALAVAAVGSFFAGCVATLLIALFSPWLAQFASSFRPAEYCVLMLFGLVAAVILAQGPPLRAIGMILVGILLGTVGTDVNSGVSRYAFGTNELLEGLDFVPVVMGLFGVAEIIANLERTYKRPIASHIASLWPTRDDMRRSVRPVLRGTALGSVLGVLPGGGALLSAFAAYALEKKIADDPSRFGKGAIEGVAAPESANNAGAQSSFVPLLTLGIPSNALMALMAGAMMIHGIIPGPDVMTKQPDLFWGLIASMWIGNLMLVIINLPLIRLWVALLRIPYRMLYLAILVFCVVGAYGISNSTFDVMVLAAFGVIGYALTRIGLEPAPLVLGFVLGPLLEENLRRALLLARGDWAVFVERPISLVLLLMTLGLLLVVILPAVRRTREAAFQED